MLKAQFLRALNQGTPDGFCLALTGYRGERGHQFL
jgi:hypothetical protein